MTFQGSALSLSISLFLQLLDIEESLRMELLQAAGSWQKLMTESWRLGSRASNLLKHWLLQGHAGWREEWCNELTCPTVSLLKAAGREMELAGIRYNKHTDAVCMYKLIFQDSFCSICYWLFAGRRKLHLHVNHCLHCWKDEWIFIAYEMFLFKSSTSIES